MDASKGRDMPLPPAATCDLSHQHSCYRLPSIPALTLLVILIPNEARFDEKDRIIGDMMDREEMKKKGKFKGWKVKGGPDCTFI
jgi:hypothetical protein